MELVVTQMKKQFDTLANERMDKNILFQKNSMDEIYLRFLDVIQRNNMKEIIWKKK